MLPTPDRIGYTFNGWRDNSRQIWSNSTLYTPQNAADTVVLRADWVGKQYKVYLNNNYGTFHKDSINPSDTIQVRYNSTLSNLRSRSRTGYKFEGWNARPDGLGATYDSTSLYNYVAANDTLYAKWSTKTYYITFDAAGGAVTTTSLSIRYDDSIKSLPVPTRIGYSCDTFWYNTDGSGGKYKAGVVKTDSIFHFTNGLALTVTWIPDTFTVRLKANGAGATIASADSILPKVVYDATLRSSNGGNALSTPIRTGYTFKGYYLYRAGTGDSVHNVSVYRFTCDTSLWAKWEANRYTIRFDANTPAGAGAVSNPDNLTVAYEQPIRTLPSVYLADYGLLGWYTLEGDRIGGGNVGVRYTNDTIYRFTHDTILYAQWRQGSVTVTYDLRYDGIKYPEAAQNDALLTEPYEPSRKGYDFACWSKDSVEKKCWDFSADSIKVDTTLYAVWDTNRYHLRLEANGTGGKFTRQGEERDTAWLLGVPFGEVVASLPKPHRKGYTFVNYNTLPSGNGVSFDSASLYNFDSDIVLYAQWEANTYTIHFDNNYPQYYDEFSKVATPSPLTVKYGEKIGTAGRTLPVLQSIAGAYEFKGWYTVDTISYSNDSIFDIVPNNPSQGSVVFMAHWEAAQHTLTLEAGNGTIEGGQFIGGAPTKPKTVTYGNPVCDLEIPERLGYKKGFRGWYSGYDGNGTQYDSSTVYLVPNSLTLHAHWVVDTFDLTLDANGGTFKRTKEDKEVLRISYKGTVAYVNLPERVGHIFSATKGWNTQSDGSGDSYSPDIYAYAFTSDTTIYAQWQKRSYIVTFRADTTYANGRPSGEIVHYTGSCLYGEKITDTAPTKPSFGELGFDGWYFNGRKWQFDTDTVSGNMTLHARWEREQPTVSRWPIASITYGDSLGQAKFGGRGSDWEVSDPLTSGGHFVFDSVQIKPYVRDSMTTKYKLWFVPDDDVRYRPVSCDTAVLKVERRNLRIQAKIVVLVLDEDNSGKPFLKTPIGYSIPSYIRNRWDDFAATSYAKWDDRDKLRKEGFIYPTDELLKADRTKELSDPARYAAYLEGVGGFRDNVILVTPDSSVPPANYKVKYEPRILYITRINYYPPEAITYGDTLALNATYSLSQYTPSLQYHSNDTSVISVKQGDNGRWVSDVRGAGRAIITVTFAGDTLSEPQVPTDTMAVEIIVNPYTELSIKVLPDTVVWGRRIPAPKFALWVPNPPFHTNGKEVKIDDLGIETYTDAHIGSDTGNYPVTITGLTNPNYAGGTYIPDNLTIITGGTTEQQLELENDIDIEKRFDTKEVVVWAAAWPEASQVAANNSSRKVVYDVGNKKIAVVARDTSRLIEPYDTFRYKVRVDDTLYGAVIRFVQAGETMIYALQEGDDTVYKAVYKTRNLIITRAPQKIIDFDVTQPMVVGNWYKLSARAVSETDEPNGLPIRFTSDDNRIALIPEGSDSVYALKKGEITITAYQDGNVNWEKTWETYPNINVWDEVGDASLKDLLVEGGTLSPAFATNVYEYTLKLPCDSAIKLVVAVDSRNYITHEGVGVFDGDSLITIEKMPFGKELTITVTAKDNGAIFHIYRIRLLAPLSNELFYHDVKNFPNKLEIINRPDIKSTGLEHPIVRYRWYRDNVLDPIRRIGIYDDGRGLGGHTYSAEISYDATNNNWVKICPIYIPKGMVALSTIEVFPNPASNQITVRYTNNVAVDNAEIRIFQSTGALVAHYPIGNESVGSFSVILDISNLTAGVYYVVVKGKEAAVMVKK
ncbi:hypothetical protein FACS189456_4720 [Bacteroidia bacterium]|nr:hypothetical protein FACS189456_4720 [Bacteroidia bacterium]